MIDAKCPAKLYGRGASTKSLPIRLPGQTSGHGEDPLSQIAIVSGENVGARKDLDPLVEPVICSVIDSVIPRHRAGADGARDHGEGKLAGARCTRMLYDYFAAESGPAAAWR